MAEGNWLGGPVAMSIRIWRTQAGAEPSELLWEGNSPETVLARDIVAASGGKAAIQDGRILTIEFPGIQSTILAARRLQWAYQGLSETGGPAGAAVAVLVHCTDSPVGPDAEPTERESAALEDLEKAAPGQILLTAKVAEILQDLPGLPIRVTTETLLCELLWNTAPDKISRIADDEIVSELIRQNGLEDKTPSAAQAITVPTAPEAPSLAANEASAEFDRSSPSKGRAIHSPILIGAGCGVAAILAIGGFFVFGHKSQNTTAPVPVQQAAPAVVIPAAAPTAAQQMPSQPSSATPASNAAPLAVQANPVAEAKTKPQKIAHSKPASSEAEKPSTAVSGGPTGSCGMDAAMVHKLLQRAEQSRADGKYEDAKRQFQTVLSCEPGNASARSGLDRTLEAMRNR